MSERKEFEKATIELLGFEDVDFSEKNGTYNNHEIFRLHQGWQMCAELKDAQLARLDSIASDAAELNNRQAKRIAALEAQGAKGMKIPKTLQEVRDFIGNNYESYEFAISTVTPTEGDKYQLSIHDLLSAFTEATYFEFEPADEMPEPNDAEKSGLHVPPAGYEAKVVKTNSCDGCHFSEVSDCSPERLQYDCTKPFPTILVKVRT